MKKIVINLLAVILLSIAAVPAMAQSVLTDEQCYGVASLIHTVATVRDEGASPEQVMSAFENEPADQRAFMQTLVDVVYSSPARAHTPHFLASDFLADCIGRAREEMTL